MKPIEISPVANNRAIGAEAARTISKSVHQEAAPAKSSIEPGMVAVSSALSAGSEPIVNEERVAEIRKAVQEGTYPLNLAKIADAMIAADFILIEGKKD